MIKDVIIYYGSMKPTLSVGTLFLLATIGCYKTSRLGFYGTDEKGVVVSEAIDGDCPRDEGTLNWGDGSKTALMGLSGRIAHKYAYNGNYKVELVCSGIPLFRDAYIDYVQVSGLGEAPAGLLGNLSGIAALITAMVGVLTFFAGRASKKKND